ncbi:MAG: phenylacetate-CoA oxygenase subunit PaaC [Chitinophagaceae bacterium]|nr:phenylacetate-CoA oxygenase subunit PaaC [Chitinophagaceae bacterium]
MTLLPGLLYLADTTLILSHRNSEWCGHGPVLEQDIAISNMSLDLIGQCRNFYQYAADLQGNGATEDSMAYLRTEREFKNLLLAELPKGDWGFTTLRQYLFSQFQYLQFRQLSKHKDERLAAIAAKSFKETTYHLRWSREWVIRLGDGTAESHARMAAALKEMWPYTGEMFMTAQPDEALGLNLAMLQQEWEQEVKQVFGEAKLDMPHGVFMHSGGKSGRHTEHLGFILAEMQYMQRAYPGCEW